MSSEDQIGALREQISEADENGTLTAERLDALLAQLRELDPHAVQAYDALSLRLRHGQLNLT